MSSKVSHHSGASVAFRLALLAFLLRLVVPLGTMPAALSDGWFLQLCPDGLPGPVMARLLGETHHHHHHDGANADTTPVRCDLGNALSGEAIKPDGLIAADPEPRVSERGSSPDTSFRDGRFLPPFRSRAPPYFPGASAETT